MPIDPPFSIPDPSVLGGPPAPVASTAPETAAQAAHADAVLERERDRLMSTKGVVMVGRGQDEIGGDAIIVGVKEPRHMAAIPKEIEGLRVVAMVIGEVDALPAKKRSR